MSKRTLSKLQIRSEILSILSVFNNIEDTPKEKQDEVLKSLKTIENKSDVFDFLLKELPKLSIEQAQVVIYLFIELGSLDELKEPLWAFIKDSNSSDELKDLAGIALRSLGDVSDTQVFLNYLDDPKAVIDKETQKLLELAKINPEAQIDFFDFLFSLPEEEQLSLISSLKTDYSGEYIVNVLVPALESNPSGRIKEALIEALGESKNEGAVSILNDIVDNSTDLKLKKLAKKNLTLLKISGIDIENNIADKRGDTLCKHTDIYECYASNVDGVGNQGIIISRIKPNQDIMMFTVVINDLEGIVDCFGFNGISKTDFSRIIHKFQEKSTRLSVSPEYCKYKLIQAERINKKNNSNITYEYSAWKILTHDFLALEEPVENIALAWGNINYIFQGCNLYNYPDFKYWFFEESDHPKIKEFLDKIVNNILKDVTYYKENIDKLFVYLNNEIKLILPEIFDDKLRACYKNRLLNIAYLMDLQGFNSFRNISSSVAISLDANYKVPLSENVFVFELMKKTVSEGFLRHRQKLKDAQLNSQFVTSWNIKKLKQAQEPLPACDDSGVCEIIDLLYEEWMFKPSC
ncbi:MAG: hypothetical protein WCK67_03660 [bacterium]